MNAKPPVKKIIWLLFFFMLSNAAFSQPNDCARFKNGKFLISDPNAGGNTMIERKGDYQIESNAGLKLIIQLKVHWLNNCSYELRFDKLIRNENNIDIPKTTMLVKITETGSKGYVQETTSPAYNGIYRSTVTIIN